MKRVSWLYNSSLVGLLAGLVFFFAVFGLNTLNPNHIEWLMEGDPAQHFLGWNFFRYEDWQIPPGKIASYGIPEGTALAYTDSIPLFAFIFKCLRTLLPSPFQYFGIWILFCYLSQGFFGWLLAAKIFSNPLQRLLAASFFVLSPVMLKRACDHQSLVGHWVLLAALYLFILSSEARANQSSRWPFRSRWMILLAVSALIHLYLCVMVIGLYLASLFLHFSFGLFKFIKIKVLELVFLLALLVITMYLSGYFVIKPSCWSSDPPQDFGFYSMNLLAPFNPMGWNPHMNGALQSESDSTFLKGWPMATGGQYEGFNYLGLGFLVLLGGAAAILFLKRGGWKNTTSIWNRPSSVLLMVCLIFSIYSILNKVTIADHVLFKISIAYFLKVIFISFRACGRFFWVPFYSIMIGTFFVYSRYFQERKILSVILMVALLVQVIDLFPFMTSVRKTLGEEKHLPILTSLVWGEAVKNCKNVYFYPRKDLTYLMPLGLIAAPRQIGLNLVSAARKDPKAFDEADFMVLGELKSAQLLTNALYVFSDQSILKNLVQAKKDKRIFIQNVDGLYMAGLVH